MLPGEYSVAYKALTCAGADDPEELLELWPALEDKLNGQIYVSLTYFLPTLMELSRAAEDVVLFDTLDSLVDKYQTVDAASMFSIA